MDKRLLIIFVVLAGLGFFYLASSNKAEKPAGTEATAEAAPEAGTPLSSDPKKATRFEESFPLSSAADDAGFHLKVSNMFATFASVQMAKKQFYQADNVDRPSGLPEELRGRIPEKYYAEGELELVSTWDPTAYPFQLGFNSFAHEGRVTREIRAERGGGRVNAAEPRRFEVAEDSADLHSSTPRVREGYLLEITSPASLRTTEPIVIAEVLGDRAFELDKPLVLSGSVEDVHYRILARGRFDQVMAADPRFTKVAQGKESLTFVWPDPSRDESDVFLERKVTVVGPYLVDVEHTLHNLSRFDLRAQPMLSTVAFQPPVEGGGLFSGPPPDQRGALCHVADDMKRATFGELAEEPQNPDWMPPGDVSWVGTESRYFLMAAIPASSANTYCRMYAVPHRGQQVPLGKLVVQVGRTKASVLKGSDQPGCRPSWLTAGPLSALPTCGSLAARLDVAVDASGKAVEEAYNRKKAGLSEAERQLAREAWEALRGREVAHFDYEIYMGPKDLEPLQSIDAPLDDAIDFWIVGVIAKPMLSALKLFHDWIPSWGVAILILTLLVKLVLFPLTQWSFKSMQAMTRLKPEMEELKKKYGNDRQKLNEETMALYKRHKVNPMGGCFPMLLQMPIWIALYRAIYSSVELYQAPLGGWIQDLSAPDPYYVLPLIMGLSMFLQQRLMPTSLDSQQAKMMMWIMPIMFTVFMLFLPSGLVLYIFVNTLLSMAQQYWIKRKDIVPPKARPKKA